MGPIAAITQAIVLCDGKPNTKVSLSVDNLNLQDVLTSIMPKMGVGRGAVNLPSIHSSEWEFEEVQLPPGPKLRRT